MFKGIAQDFPEVPKRIAETILKDVFQIILKGIEEK